MSLIEMSVSGAVLILVILAVRAALKDRLPKRTFAVLWMAALLRLLVPFSVPSAWSAYTFLPNVSDLRNVVSDLKSVALDLQNAAPGSENEATDFEQSSLPSTFSANISEEALSETIPMATEQPEAKPFNRNMLWAAGFLISLAFFAWIYGRCLREFQMSLPVEKGILGNWRETHPLRRKLSIRQSDQIASPISYGVWRPVILLSKSVKSGDRFRLRYVLEHEYVHIQYFDAAVKLLMAAALCVHWFNPFVYLMYVFFNRDLELACDETVVRRFGEEEKAAYAMALIEMEEEKSGLLPLGNSFSKNAIEERIGAIMKIKKITPLAKGMSAALVCGITLLFVTSCGTYGEAEKIQAASPQAEAVGTQVTNEKNSVNAKSFSAVLEESKKGSGVIRQTAYDPISKSAEKDGKIKAIEEAEAEASEEAAVQAVKDAVAEKTEKQVKEAVEKAVQDARKKTAAEYTTDQPYHSAAHMISISDAFEEYEKFGLSYDKKSDYLMYQDNTVGYFKDEIKRGVYTRLVEGSGKLGIIVNRDDSGEITEFTVFPFDESSVSDSSVQEEGDAVYEQDQGLEISAEASSYEAAYDEGDPDAAKSSVPKEYAKLGVKLSDEKNNLWMYKGKGVAVIYDKDHAIFTNDSISEKNAVYLEVIRDKKDRVTGLKEVTKKEMQKLVRE